MIKGIIFDMDGLIVDSEPIQCRSYIEALSKYNVDLKEQDFYEDWTVKGHGIKDFVGKENLDLDPNTIREEKRQIYHKKIKKELEIYPGAREIIEALSKKYPLAIATSSYRSDTEIVLDLFDLKKFFPIIITSDDISKGKPDPEQFLLASEGLSVAPENCLVLEDAEKGVKAADRANMKCIAIPSEYTESGDFSLATIKLKSIKELTVDLIESL